MSDLKLRDLRYLVAVADSRHFGRAALACHVSQPTLSAQLKKLEAYLGVQLVERGTRRASLTAAGQRIVTRARAMLEAGDDIVEIAKVIAQANDSMLDDGAAQRVQEAATLLSQRRLNGKPALDIAGNGRYARQLVEAGEQNRDMRLARSLDFESLDVEQLSEINPDDMAAAIAAVHGRLNIGE